MEKVVVAVIFFATAFVWSGSLFGDGTSDNKLTHTMNETSGKVVTKLGNLKNSITP